MIQQKIREMNKCKICYKETKNKVYCSINCQHNGYKELKVSRVECSCLYCNITFETLQNKVDNGKKYCSRDCKDKHQKELYLKEGNPVYGNNHTDEWKGKASIRVKELWNTDEFRDKVTAGQEKFFEDNGFWMGTDDTSNNKRINSNLERYGVKLGKLLLDNNIKFETQYDVYYEETKFKTYDFYLIDFNLLIEADGDYWHVNPVKYNQNNILTETQEKNIENDKFKNKLAKDNRYNLIRFWESDIKKKNFKYRLFNKIKEYGKKEN